MSNIMSKCVFESIYGYVVIFLLEIIVIRQRSQINRRAEGQNQSISFILLTNLVTYFHFVNNLESRVIFKKIVYFRKVCFFTYSTLISCGHVIDSRFVELVVNECNFRIL
ncbi:hypothetical protein LINPERPRIM_LOCUS27343 [Linum perenne]